MNSSLCLSVVTFGWLLSSLFYLTAVMSRKPLFVRGSTYCALLVFCAHAFGLGLRWYESYNLGIGHVPLSNLYESLVFGAFALMGIWIGFQAKFRELSLGFIASLIAFLAMAYASFSPNVNDKIQPLIPALKSNWLIAHVITCFLGYGAFAISFGISLVYLLKNFYGPRGILRIFPDLKLLEGLNYKVVVFGFFWLTVGIVTGSVWADSAWGSYWSWDPKETWSLITWLLYAALLHARSARGWQGQRVALLSFVGFLCVMFTYFGVNFLLSGLHSYGAK